MLVGSGLSQTVACVCFCLSVCMFKFEFLCVAPHHLFVMSYRTRTHLVGVHRLFHSYTHARIRSRDAHAYPFTAHSNVRARARVCFMPVHDLGRAADCMDTFPRVLLLFRTPIFTIAGSNGVASV
eukprot:GDKI01023195.1.p1 GENE.GDKI01023195.1~~GDKI01023195.1.p1  ORF type:complete len:125 (+),score=12.27 GDKI01023195.1:29-403(+)